MRSPRALRVYLAMKAGTWFCFTTAFTLSALYRIETVGLDPLQLVLLGTVLEGTIFLCEIPTAPVGISQRKMVPSRAVPRSTN